METGGAMGSEVLATPLYEPAEAARLVGLTKGQVVRWLFGYSYPYREHLRRQNPLVRRQLGTRDSRQASFLDLIELRAAKLFLDHGLSPQKVRRAFNEAQEVCKEPFPFASRRLYQAGPRIFLELGHQRGAGRTDVHALVSGSQFLQPKGSGLLELLTGGQWVIEPLMRDYLEQLEFDEQSGLAATWWPMGRAVPVLIAPRRAFGAPTVRTRNVKTSAILDLYLAEGRHTKPVARWFELDDNEVEAAVQYEEGLSDARAA